MPPLHGPFTAVPRPEIERVLIGIETKHDGRTKRTDQMWESGVTSSAARLPPMPFSNYGAISGPGDNDRYIRRSRWVISESRFPSQRSNSQH